MAQTIQIKGYPNTKTIINLPKVKPPKEIKNYIMVSGLDYHDIWSFKSYSKKEEKRIKSSIKNNEIQIIYNIDILSGNITKTEINGVSETQTVSSYEKITKSNYLSGHTFDAIGKSNYITKNTIYDIVKNIAKNEPNTLVEMHVFSHAYWNGPILANTSSTDTVDIDMRRDDAKTVGADFNVAIDPNGFVKIWGCSFPKKLNTLFSRLRKNPDYNLKTISDTTIFTYPANHFRSKETVDYINLRLKSSFDVAKKIDLTFKEIKHIAALEYNSVFAAFLAYYADVNVYAALPATYAEISPSFTISSKTIENVKLYTNHLGIVVDSENYGLYSKANVERLKK